MRDVDEVPIGGRLADVRQPKRFPVFVAVGELNEPRAVRRFLFETGHDQFPCFFVRIPMMPKGVEHIAMSLKSAVLTV